MLGSAEDVPVIVVGGGAVLCADALPGASAVHRPEHADVANAIGAAIPQVRLSTYLHCIVAVRQSCSLVALFQNSWSMQQLCVCRHKPNQHVETPSLERRPGHTGHEHASRGCPIAQVSTTSQGRRRSVCEHALRLPPLQVSGVSEGIYELHGNARERARVLKEATGRAEQRAIDAGAAHEGCQVCTQHPCVCTTCKTHTEQRLRLQ